MIKHERLIEFPVCKRSQKMFYNKLEILRISKNRRRTCLIRIPDGHVALQFHRPIQKVGFIQGEYFQVAVQSHICKTCSGLT